MISSSGVTASAANTSSSTMGPAGLLRICGQIWSLPCFRVKTTVFSSGASVDSRLYSSVDGPFSSAIANWRSKLNFTSDEVSSLPFAKVSPSLRTTVYSVGEVNSADSAMSGSTSAVPGTEFMMNGYTLFMIANDPLSYEPAGSRNVTLSVVPIVIASPPAGVSVPPAQPARTSTAAAVPPSTARPRLLFVDPDDISDYLSVVWTLWTFGRTAYVLQLQFVQCFSSCGNTKNGHFARRKPLEMQYLSICNRAA